MKYTLNKGDYAFTFMEMLLSMAIVGVLVASTYTSFSAAHKADRKMREVSQNTQVLHRALGVIEKDLKGVVTPTGVLRGDFVGEDFGQFDGADSDYVLFHRTATTVGTSRSGKADIEQIEYLLVDDPDDGGAYQLVRQVSSNLLAMEEEEPVVEVVCEGVRHLGFRYYDGYEWLETWDTSGNGQVLPVAVEVSLGVYPQAYVKVSDASRGGLIRRGDWEDADVRSDLMVTGVVILQTYEEEGRASFMNQLGGGG
ncbi:type II secretion system protein GspJ [Poriferisphaera sp. WC338]|uniref:type II secretion system protein GspJ n=1 Tax=Poriferisphaera sp. WC338 TaxID=3425129 RepID=UPI003D812D17